MTRTPVARQALLVSGENLSVRSSQAINQRKAAASFTNPSNVCNHRCRYEISRAFAGGVPKP
jgi:hypothetical protein